LRGLNYYNGPHRWSLQLIDGGLYLAQRFAIDFNMLDAEHRLSAGNPSLLSNYPSYDQPVLAVADATVVVAVDQNPDQGPGQTVGVTLENADGNHIVLDLGDGSDAFYARLAPGSITVQVSDRITQGQQIGRLGNSGSSDGPHLHFQVMDHPSALVANGLPYVFAGFDLTGQFPPLAEAAPYYEAQQSLPITTNAGPRRDELPLGSEIVTFPESGT
jgi:murein DD-endopeptidase MepM/ murein hydrolase activator NlpD